jgi:hypothetical protein
VKYRPIVCFACVMLSVPACLRAQNPDKSANVVQPQSASVAVVPKPARKADQVITNDSIGLLAVRRVPRVIAAPVVESSTAREERPATDAAGRKAAETALLQKLIQEKQKRIALLMKLFVDDEKEFLIYGGAAEADPVAQERRRYEQDELRWETAEVAKLQAQLEDLKSEK